MQRFFVESDAIQGGKVRFPESAARQMEKVLRLDLARDEVIVLDNSGKSYRVRLNGRQAGLLSGEILETKAPDPRLELRLELGFSLTKREKVEWILQKGTELGVSVFRPFVSERSLDRDLKLEHARQERWNAIIREAAEQSQRSRLPELCAPRNFRELLTAFPSESVRLFAWEGAAPELQMRPEWFRGAAAVGLLVGPEGGFSLEEAGLAKAAGFRLCSLGRRVLRMETACLTACALSAHYLETAR
ncbi:MAG: 16S rRNA (uracil(1498)-N(3))-methyltransferase [Chloroflexi bacterium]|jgi:16S rRNA (uracil1498-N3)-methyltransferase|nr:16S rRNA (uracil(1498)-N(3))-methyltransferase [Chloroflexota bacterium]HOE35353.1 16S rRNA (uracil(1498)-N(3))-methyltransferase [Anaerolineaceae bacterium]HOT25924.1 16S rRNA (uracil(1498)-N(3))-methyltransferase [Anaerolineaceae bacterium]HQH58358.1 16S rRNA (uracil(1498)-N(3))-methyltransferase [Anaerolineaceae bacterium]HQK03589.1 16S rRNA (uracil(1498)-N(3))-methyltransferase [Anaerolineaceae bacterium]